MRARWQKLALRVKFIVRINGTNPWNWSSILPLSIRPSFKRLVRGWKEEKRGSKEEKTEVIKLFFWRMFILNRRKKG
jgi:hypothetical protein